MSEEKNKEKGKKIRVRIVHKCKAGLTLDFKEAGGLKTINWDDFNKIYQICENNPMWAEPTDEYQAKLEEIDEHINNAVLDYILSGKYAESIGKKAETDPQRELTYMVALGGEIEKIQELTGFDIIKTSQLIKTRCKQFIESMNEPFESNQDLRELRRESREWERKERAKGNPTVVHTSTNSLGDNPVLQQLKEQMNKENQKIIEK